MSDRLVTHRLVLRRMQPGDAPSVFAILSANDDIGLYLGYESMKSEDQVRRILTELHAKEERQEAMYWCVVHRDHVVGMVYFVQLDLHPSAWAQRSGMLGYWLDRQSRNVGFATEAAQAVIEFGFSVLRLHKIKIGHVSDNAASRNVVRKLGFRLVGEEQNEFYWHGRWMNHTVYELLSTG